MERKLLDEFHDDNRPTQEQAAETWDARRKEWIEFSEILLDCLRRSPSSDQMQLLVDLLRHDTTLGDIERAIRERRAHIKCDSHAAYLDPIEIAFVVTDPILNSIAAVRRLLVYDWTFDDDTSPPPNVDRCRHYFSRRRLRPVDWLRLVKQKRWHLMEWLQFIEELFIHNLQVSVTIPFSTIGPEVFTRSVKLGVQRRLSASRVADGIGFAMTAAIAVVTAFAAKYATGLPDVISWSDCLTAFLLGFGLDQLRDTVAPSAPSPAPAPLGGRPSDAAPSMVARARS